MPYFNANCSSLDKYRVAPPWDINLGRHVTVFNVDLSYCEIITPCQSSQNVLYLQVTMLRVEAMQILPSPTSSRSVVLLDSSFARGCYIRGVADIWKCSAHGVRPASVLPRKFIHHSRVFPEVCLGVFQAGIVLTHSNGHLTPKKPIRNVGFHTPGWKKQAHNLRLTSPPLFLFYKPL